MDLMSMFSKINGVLDNMPKKPEIPTLLLGYAAQQNAGISTARVTSNIIASMAGANINTTDMPSGAANLVNKMIEIIVQEVFHELTHNARIETGGQMGSVTISAEGANAGGPVTVVGRNIMPNKSYGIIQ